MPQKVAGFPETLLVQIAAIKKAAYISISSEVTTSNI